MSFLFFLSLCLILLSGCGSVSIDTAKLSVQHQAMVEGVLQKLDPMIQQRRNQGDIAALTCEELYEPLDPEQKQFLAQFQKIDPKQLNIAIPFRGISAEVPKLTAIKGQIMDTPAGPQAIPTQFLPQEVLYAYSAMMDAMKRDIGKIVYVESGYRSPAYQLYLFLFYLKNHDYSVVETARFVAWPGYSEHGGTEHQAIDFVNQEGIDGQSNPSEFEALGEYRWLAANAGRFNFELSYPKNSTMAFEPWHWRYKGK